MGMDFVALDFETACERLDSICAVGLARVRDGVVVETSGILVNPECEFKEWNTRLHGISNEDVFCAPTFQELWPELKQFIGTDTIICHNAAFDINALELALGAFGQASSNEYACTLELAQRLWPGLRSYRLNTLSQIHGIPLNHHNASSDAEACARLALKMAEQCGANSILELVQYAESRPLEKESRNRKAHGDGEAWAFYEKATETPIFQGFTVVFTGNLDGMERPEAMQIVTRLGGTVRTGVSRKTDIVVLGTQTSDRIVGQYSTKHQNALDLIAAGCPITIADAKRFFGWLREGRIELDEGAVMKGAIMNENLLYRAPAYGEFLEYVVQICGSKNRPFVEAKFAKDEKYLSIFFYRQLALRYTIGKKICHIEIDGDSVKEPERISTTIKPVSIGDDVKLRFSIDEVFNWDEFSRLVLKICNECRKYAPVEEFGCCSSYVECSDVKECLKWDTWDYLGCMYRRNLEAGHIFYGKNKTI